MIIENAFLKLPELLTSTYAHRDTFESTVVHFLSTAILMELDSRNVARHFEHLATEKPYPTKSADNLPIHCDLFVSLTGAIPTNGRLSLYGSREENWIEAKAFMSSIRGGSSPQKTVNVGKIIRDILRLCLLPEELQGKIRKNGRYLLLTFSNPPSQSLALRDRDWILRLLEDRDPNVTIDINDEAKSLRGAIGPGFITDDALSVGLNCRTYAFQPDGDTSAPVFWGYLIRIKKFNIAFSGKEVKYDDLSDKAWSAENERDLEVVRREIINSFKSAT